MGKLLDINGNEVAEASVTVEDSEVVDVTEDMVTETVEDIDIPEVAKEISQEITDPKVFAEGDFCLSCGICGGVETLQSNIRGGLRFDMYTTDQHRLTLKCKNCGAKMDLFFKESVIDTTIKDVEYEPVLEENKIEEQV